MLLKSRRELHRLPMFPACHYIGCFTTEEAMPRTLAPCVVAAVSLLAFGAGCTTEPTEPPPPPPPPPAFLRWSDGATWPGGAVPAAGAAVMIPSGRTVLLDVSPPPLGGLTVDGTLRFDRKDLNLTANWIMVHGNFEVGTENEPFLQRAVITLNGLSTDDIEGMGAKVFAALGGTIELHGQPRVGWARLAATASIGSAQLQMERSVDWRPGDRIVLASTDLDPNQSEEAVVASASGNTVTLQTVLRYNHWGVTQSFGGKTLDERAEVGLLTRNVVLQGDDASLVSQFGGHMIITQGGTAHIEGVEITKMGQKKVLARYPMHWHMMGAVNGQYFRRNSIWRTFNRCVTVHGSNNAAVQGNVCYDNLGHAYFLEDGAETGNTFEDNLGVLTQRAPAGQELLPSDVTPATFWITNPDNSYRGNVAAGSKGFGFWYALPVSPTGLSTGSPLRPREIALREFSDNVAHSNSNTGLNVDNGPNPDGTTGTAHYSPRQVPGTNSPAVPAYFRNFTGYKHNNGRAVWLRGTELRLVDAMLADNSIGATFASNETFVTDAVFVGLSANTGGTQHRAGFPIRGYEFYDGRVGAERVTFVNYVSSGARTMSALGFNRTNGFPVDPANYGNGLTFINANNVFLDNPAADKDGDKAAIILDSDGTVTGTAGSYVVANNPLMLTPTCAARAAWNAWICRTPFVQLQVRGGNSQSVAPLNVIRDDAASATYVGVPGQPQTVVSSLVPSRTYRVQYAGSIPDRPQFTMRRSVAGDWIRIIAQYPNIPFNVIRDSNNGSPLPAAATLAELDGSTGDRYFYDAATGLVHLKAVTQSGRTQATLFVVPR